MTFIQQFLTAVLPEAWAEDMRAESLAWMMRCTCGFERSIWESGGIRWKAKGSPRRLLVCPQCGQRTWHTVYRSAVQLDRNNGVWHAKRSLNGKEVTTMPNNLTTGIRGVLLIVIASIVAVGMAILIIVISVLFLIDASNCYALGPSLLALWGTIAAVFLASGIVVTVVAWRIAPSTVGRLLIVVTYGVVMLVTYTIIAFGIMLAFDC